MLAVHPSIQKINHSSRKKRKMVAGWNSPRRKGDASYPSIKPEISHSSIKEKGNNGRRMETS
jgi:hypothetical protein